MPESLLTRARRLAPGPLLAVLLFLLLGSFTARAQAPANDDPCGAVTLTANGSLCTSPTLSTNVGATTTTPNGYTLPSGCGTASQPKDVWFKFTTSASGPSSFGVAITVTGNPAGIIRLFSAPSCSGPFTDAVVCSAATTPNTVAPRLTTGSLTANTTYYIQVAGSTNADTPGQFTICLTDGPATPTCGVPQIGGFVSTGLTSGEIPITLGLNNAFPITVVLQTLPNQNPIATYTVNSSAPLVLTGLTPGANYRIQATATCPTGGQSTSSYSIRVPIPNDESCGAIDLPLNGTVCTPTQASNNGATASANSNFLMGCGGQPSARRDVWFKVTTAASGPGSTSFYVTVDGEAAKRILLLSAASCSSSFTQLACVINAGSAGSAPVLNATNLTPNTTYYLLVDNTGFFTTGTEGPFTICVASVPPCPPLTLAPTTTSITSTTARVLFNTPNAPPAPTSYTVTYTPQGGTATTVQVPSGPATLTGLMPGTTYSVCVAGNCAGGGQAPPVCTSFTTLAACPTPTGLNVTNVTTTSAQLNFTGPSNGTGYTITLTPQGGTPVTITANGSPVQLPNLTPSTEYTVSVVASCGASLTSQPATLTFSSSAPCPAVTGLTVTPTTTSSATVRFSGPANATGYVVTYVPVGGGTPLNLQVTASPVLITSLTPLTAYTITVTTLCTGNLASQPATTVYTGLPYCATGLGGSCPPSINTVAIPGTTLNSPSTGCAGTSGNYYMLYPASGSTTTILRQGQSYQFSVTPSGSDSDIMAWIDFNRNGQFEASEGTQVVLAGASNVPAVANFTVPATAQLGPTGMRVRTRIPGAGLGPGDACTQVGSGETEDYVVTIDVALAVRSNALAAQVSVYPNPAQQSFQLTLPAQLSRAGVQATLLNALGQPVQQQHFAPAAAGLQAQVEVGRLPRGVYTLHLTTAAGPVTKRVVVE
ncbi:fibronectin type III domain-containing protein [Hymenobacter gummosus]|nr:fibronectin type III domain-containing protein [Hymenobacter gummosus]